MDAYADIEARTGFHIPEIYRRMRANGLCDYGASQEEWRATFEQRTLENPPALLPTLDFEWMHLDEMASWSAPEYWLPEHVFVPFAGDGHGDIYAWFPNWTDDRGTPIVRAHHDENSCEVLAPDFESFLYRMMLEAFRWCRYLEEGLNPVQERQALRAAIEVLRPYLRPNWIDELVALVDRLPRAKERGLVYQSRLDDSELHERLLAAMSFPRLDHVFPHMMP